MESELWEQIQHLFLEASARAEPERTVYLRGACQDDPAIISEVLAMMEADAQGASLLDRGLAEVACQMIPPPGHGIQVKEVGPYRLLRFLGEGGMGSVHLVQREDVGKPVAMKFLLHAGLSPARRERFAREIKLLGKLNHPAIARLYDAGSLDDGTPWFVMEYVDGKRLMEYCRETSIPPRELIGLFKRICEAVQYAHGQAIIHRDLKPSNIMVDSAGEPRLLDFGVAKELHSLDEEADQTRSGLRLLTPEYAAPEWAEHGIVGAYTDVYSLGVILYQMLAGEPRPKDFGQEAKPSESGKRVQGFGKADWRDLDRLCLTATRASVPERYQSVEALVRDLEHYLHNEPLEAQPPSLRYTVAKFVRRNRNSVLAASIALILFAGMATYFTFRLAQERNAALKEATRTRHIQRFMLNLFGGESTGFTPSKDLRVLSILDAGAKEAGDLREDPGTQGEIYQTLGRLYRMLGDVEKAGGLNQLALERMKAAWGQDNSRVAESLVQMGLLKASQGQFPEAERLVRNGLGMAQRHLPAGDTGILEAQVALAQVWAGSRATDRAIRILDPIVARPPSGEDGPRILSESLNVLAVAEHDAGHYERSAALDRRALDLDQHLYGKAHPQVAFDLANLGAVEASIGHYPAAEGYYRTSIQIGSSWLGQNNPDVLGVQSILGAVLSQEGKLAEADVLLERLLPLQEQTFGKNHPYVGFALDALGKVKYRRGDMDAAQRYFRRAVDVAKELYGDQDYNSAVVESDLSDVYVAKGEVSPAEELLRKANDVLDQRPRPGNPSIGSIRLKFGHVLVQLGRYREAESPLELGYALLAAAPPPTYTKRLETAHADLLKVYTALGETGKADQFRVAVADGKH
jgi:serine/threonine-protein kinase